MQNFSSSRIMELLTCFLVMAAIFDCGTHAVLAPSDDVKTMKSTRCGKCVSRDDFGLKRKYYCDCRAEQPRRDCREFNENGYHGVDGLYVVTMNNNNERTVVYCDQTTQKGGWTVIQRRYNGSVDFYRNWASYKNGFGDLHGEFWLGNEHIHVLTAQAAQPSGSEARLFISPYNDDRNDQYYAAYSHFRVENEKANYTLHVTSSENQIGYFMTSDNQPFSTYDRDNDNARSHHCARDYQNAGWWINGSGDRCASTKTNLNGPYDKYKTRRQENRMSYGPYYYKSYRILVRRL